VTSIPEQARPGGDAAVRFLVVDDTKEVRWLVRVLLEDEPSWEVVAEGATGAEAVDQAAAVRPDVVLLDMSMPVMDGLEALPQLRELLPDALLVLLTAFPVSEVDGSARSFGADACLDKVAMADNLVPALRTLLARR